MLILTRDDLARLLSPRDVMAALAAAFRAQGRGAVTVPPRGSVPAARDGVLLLMPAMAAGMGLGAKLVTFYGDNRGRGHPSIYATYILMDEATGCPLALLEGTYLTAVRTGATSALAASFLARPDASHLVCFGAGVQAEFQVRCLAAIRPLQRVSVVGRDPGRAAMFASAMAEQLGIPVVATGNGRAAVREADLVTCATTSTTPVVHGHDVRAGTHVDAVGAFRPSARELDSALIARARLVVDTYAGALEEAGDVLIPIGEGTISRADIAAELAELVTGARTGRSTPEEITVFKSVGFALEDLATARLAYDRALAAGAGTTVPL